MVHAVLDTPVEKEDPAQICDSVFLSGHQSGECPRSAAAIERVLRRRGGEQLSRIYGAFAE